MNRRVLFALFVVLAGLAGAIDLTITWNQWPYGVRYIGSYSKWWMTADGSHITVPVFNPDDTIWDMTNIGGSAANRNAESWIMDRSAAQGTPPAPCTYAEKQIQGGQTSWGYEHMDTTGGTQSMWLYGFYTQGTQITYEPPYQQVYQFPMEVGNTWTCDWSWDYMGADMVYENRQNYVVAKGWVKVQADTTRYYPCLVIRTYSTTTDDLGMLNDHRIIHEWVVPDMGAVGGSVCTIQSQNGAVSPDFTDAEHIFRMKEFHSTFDNTPPAFAQTTRVPSGYFLGPFSISSSITDPGGILRDSLYFRIGSGSWVSVGHDSLRSGVYYYTIPELTAADSVRYYLAATDNSTGRNRGTDPAGAPAACYAFLARDPHDDHVPPVVTGTTQYNDTTFGGPFLVTATVTDSCSVDTVRLLYRFNTAAEQPVAPDSVRGSAYYMTIPQAPMNTFIRYRIRAVDASPNHNGTYDPGSGYYSFNVIDGAGPVFAGTTELYDTTYGGPFYLTSRIADVSGVFTSSIFFKYGSLAWDSLPTDSSRGDTFSFHLPVVPSPMSVRYYLKAWDDSQNHNSATDPANAPASYYVFYCDPSGAVEEQNPRRLTTGLLMASVNPDDITLSLPEAGPVMLMVYDISGGVAATIAAGDCGAGRLRFPIPSGLANGSYVLKATLGDAEMRRGFVVSR
jgi:hypothetical protein